MNSVIEEKIDLLVKKQVEMQEEIVNLIGLLQNPKEEVTVNPPLFTNVEDAIESFRDMMEKRQQFHFDNEFPDMKWIAKISLKKGSKFMRLFDNSTDGCGTCVRAFVNLSTGQIYKPASHKIPAKHARGNVFNEDNGAGSMDTQGRILYLKG